MILIALGANLTTVRGREPVQTCEWALIQLSRIPDLIIISHSPWYISAPVPASGQPPYINGAACCEGSLSAAALLAQLHVIEQLSGRVRGLPNAARTLDLDLIDHHGLISAGPQPILPHPRAHLRAFVLRPIQDIAPEWRHPVLDRTAAGLLADLPAQTIAPLTLAHPTPIL